MQSQTDEVDLQALLQGLAHQVRWVLHQRGRHQYAQDADRNIDEEDPAPREVVRDPASQRRADDGRHNDAHAVHGHGHALLFLLEAFYQDGLRDGLQTAAAGALDHAEQDQQEKIGRDAARERAQREEDDATDIQPLAPEQHR